MKKIKKRKKRRGKILSTKSKELKTIKNIKKTVQEGGLKLSWIRFIDEYIANGGNGTRAYFKVFNTPERRIKRSTATTEASELLSKPNIIEEINHRLTSQRCTDDWIKGGLIDIAVNYRGAKTINASVRALETLAKIKGMLIDTKRVEFSKENPAIFMPVYNVQQKENFDKMKKENKRLVE